MGKKLSGLGGPTDVVVTPSSDLSITGLPTAKCSAQLGHAGSDVFGGQDQAQVVTGRDFNRAELAAYAGGRYDNVIDEAAHRLLGAVEGSLFLFDKGTRILFDMVRRGHISVSNGSDAFWVLMPAGKKLTDAGKLEAARAYYTLIARGAILAGRHYSGGALLHYLEGSGKPMELPGADVRRYGLARAKEKEWVAELTRDLPARFAQTPAPPELSGSFIAGNEGADSRRWQPDTDPADRAISEELAVTFGKIGMEGTYRATRQVDANGHPVIHVQLSCKVTDFYVWHPDSVASGVNTPPWEYHVALHAVAEVGAKPFPISSTWDTSFDIPL